MGNPKRIPMDAIQAMKKTLDALPDKNLGKTQEEALVMLTSNIQKAYSKDYSAKELAAIMTNGKVSVSAPTLRAHTCPSSPRTRKEKPQAEVPKNDPVKPVKPETQKTTPARKAEAKNEPSFYTPDLPDTEL
jgi:hypothetical protein